MIVAKIAKNSIKQLHAQAFIGMFAIRFSIGFLLLKTLMTLKLKNGYVRGDLVFLHFRERSGYSHRFNLHWKAMSPL